jgi:nucleotide-binding universal stress UspA family protein
MSIDQDTRSAVFPRRRVDPGAARIVVGVDAGADAYAALRHALAEADRRGGTVLALTVLDPRQRADWPLERDPQAEHVEQQDRLATRVGRAMTEHEARTGRPVPPVQLRVVHGDTTTELARAAADADLLVLGRPALHRTDPDVTALRDRCPVVLVDEHGYASRPA